MNITEFDVCSRKRARKITLTLWVDPALPWDRAVQEAGPCTPAHYSIWQVGGSFAPVACEGALGCLNRELTLLNLPDDSGAMLIALEWARSQCLKHSTPRDVFRLSKTRALLHEEIGADDVHVVGTETCIHQGLRSACCSWWSRSPFPNGRGAELGSVGCFGRSNCWFAFVG